MTIRILACLLLLAPTLTCAAPVALTRLVPADAVVVLHTRDLAAARTGWAGTSWARAWAEPEMRRFFAPAIALMEDPETGFASSLRRETGLSFEEFLALFAGEAICALQQLPSPGAAPSPEVLLAVDLASADPRVEKMLSRSGASASETTEEFQGETLHIRSRPALDGTGAPAEGEAWAIVDQVLLFAQPKAALQQAIVALKRGGRADSFAEHPSCQSFYKRSPDAHVLLHIGLEELIRSALAGLEASADLKDPEGRPVGPAAWLGSYGLTPRGLFDALGLGALRDASLGVSFAESEIVAEMDLRWSEQRGLLKLAAWGPAPVAFPEFIPDSWDTATIDNLSARHAIESLLAMLVDVSPFIDGMVRQQIQNMNTELGFDIQRDLIGSLGDTMITGSARSAGGVDQIMGFSLSNPAVFRSSIDTLLGRTPLGAMVQTREYLGETIRSFGQPGQPGVSIAITASHLFIAVGNPAILESALQGQHEGAARPFWKRADVARALASLPDGACGTGVADLGIAIETLFDYLIASLPSAPPSGVPSEEDEQEAMVPEPSASPRMVDPAARPSRELIRRFWSTSASATYSTPNGLRFIVKMENPR